MDLIAFVTNVSINSKRVMQDTQNLARTVTGANKLHYEEELQMHYT